ncbi:YggS family pyridoxal phosphate-dependent enzyme [Bacillus aquiflavi]|uniref:Pyridoxal phosphate homeostasis protein n=1 Tax=Bacillus aquiflavi TaxID=2672567 RepID=A0A6B3W1K1_9BACI|nr:YggS family pyridoxal phosphate-dependent enzyme [Bacillus aquiflavi]MBA4537596.1 YggS family pyridoxal phosphate-dependent enzyme [Bacillus aquiflavi]NEY81853.1 YggS family pyridoxal phosphate-dependent enzyme [Bacillus aquiflavi]UAC49316.1 YggS family pyridoxal phosphate-dependent enzyme [Bacillus aquiflavi]
MKVESKLKLIQKQIQEACHKVNRDVNDVKIIAVTKYVSIERAKEAVEAGIIHLGENRDNGFLEKWEALGDKPVWHFIGTLQSRKVKNIIHKVDYVHSLDRLSLAKEMNKRANRKINCFVQVNVSGEESKQGMEPSEVKKFILKLKEFENIKVVGLMTMAPLTDNEPVIRSCFRKLKLLQTELQKLNLDYAPCHELSMGMSNDFSIAIEEGATMIRVGTALVGEDD